MCCVDATIGGKMLTLLAVVYVLCESTEEKEHRFGSRPEDAALSMSSQYHGASTTTTRSPPANNDTLRSLIVQKEKELHEINEYRIHSLETELQERVRIGPNLVGILLLTLGSE